MLAKSVCGVPNCPEPAMTQGLCRRHRRVRGRPWKRLREQALARARYRCEGCGAAGLPLEVHHVRSLRLGGPELPPLAELVVYCRRCHLDAQQR